jgi:hypothetical protein
MALQYSTTLRNNKLDQVESTAGTAALLKLLSGTSAPANPAAADTGTTVAIMALPSDWMAAASGGTKAKSGTWQVSAVATASITYFRIYDSVSAACIVQGLISQTTASGEMIVDSSAVSTGQVVTVNTFTLTAGNP